MAFKQAGTLSPFGGPVLRSDIIANSTTRTELDSVKISSGFVAAGTAGALVYGHVMALVTNNGIGLNTTGAAGAAIGSFVNAYTVASNNQTVAKVRAVSDISKETIYSVDPDATIGTTTGSNLLGYFTDIASATQTDEDTAAATTCQYGILGVDPLVSANQLVHIFESQVFGV